MLFVVCECLCISARVCVCVSYGCACTTGVSHILWWIMRLCLHSVYNPSVVNALCLIVVWVCGFSRSPSMWMCVCVVFVSFDFLSECTWVYLKTPVRAVTYVWRYCASLQFLWFRLQHLIAATWMCMGAPPILRYVNACSVSLWQFVVLEWQ